MKSLLWTVGSLALSAAVVVNAFYQKKQFYPSIVYITKSPASMAVLYQQAFVIVILLGKVMRKVFFGCLRAAEFEHLIERFWYALAETCLAFAVFREDFSPRFVALFTALLFLKCFHWLAEDRIDYMERSPVISIVFHLRALSLLLLLAFMDSYFVNHAYHNTLIGEPSVQLVFGFEYAILFIAVIHVFVKYVLHAIDLRNENPWENKAMYILYTELILGVFKLLLYLIFLAIMIEVHIFPLFIIWPIYLTIRDVKKALNDAVMSRRAIQYMNTLYPDATPDELSSGDNVCIICREEMHVACKKLPCNHIFHSSCLRSWFQRQQTCPTCRMDVVRTPVRPQNQQLQQPPLPPPAGLQIPQGPIPLWPPNLFPPMPPHLQQPGFPPPPPPPTEPSSFAGLNEEQLRSMENEARANIEARVQLIRDIQALLHAAVLETQQYTSVVTTGFIRDPQQLNFASRSTSSAHTEASSDSRTSHSATASNSKMANGSISKTSSTDDNDELLPEAKEIESDDQNELGEIRRRCLESLSSCNSKKSNSSQYDN